MERTQLVRYRSRIRCPDGPRTTFKNPSIGDGEMPVHPPPDRTSSGYASCRTRGPGIRNRCHVRLLAGMARRTARHQRQGSDLAEMDAIDWHPPAAAGVLTRAIGSGERRHEGRRFPSELDPVSRFGRFLRIVYQNLLRAMRLKGLALVCVCVHVRGQ